MGNTYYMHKYVLRSNKAHISGNTYIDIAILNMHYFSGCFSEQTLIRKSIS